VSSRGTIRIAADEGAILSLAVLIAIVVAVAALAVGAMYLSRRLFQGDAYISEMELGSNTFGFVGTAFAVLLAFVIVQAYDSFTEAREGVETEAISVVELSRTADHFSPADGRLINGLLLCYGRAVIDHEWPAMREGAEGDRLVGEWAHELRDAEPGFRVRTPIEEAAFLTFLEEQDEMVEARRARLHEAVRQLPAPVWFLLALGALMTIAWILLLANRRERFAVQASVIGSVAALVATGILLIWFLDHPYSEEAEVGGVGPQEMEESLETVEEEATIDFGRISPPCDLTGAPLERRV
jgi:Protein of unknown function (DUF4239)